MSDSKTTLRDVLTAIAIGLALCAALLHSLDALFY
jgi:hypothetical protein